jgi:succinyl-CoA synthetase beta subunit
MNIHEYQAKAVLKEFGAPVAEGVAIFSADEAKPLPKACRARSGSSNRRSTPVAAARASSRNWMPDAKGGVRLAFSQGRSEAHAKKCSATRW